MKWFRLIAPVAILLILLFIGGQNCAPTEKRSFDGKSLALQPFDNGEWYEGGVFTQNSETVCPDGSTVYTVILHDEASDSFYLSRFKCEDLDPAQMIPKDQIQISDDGQSIIYRGSSTLKVSNSLYCVLDGTRFNTGDRHLSTCEPIDSSDIKCGANPGTRLVATCQNDGLFSFAGESCTYDHTGSECP